MGKRKNYDVRAHSQEREYLQNLGGGSLIDGVRNLIQDLQDRRSAQKDYYYYSKGNRRKLSSWRNS